MTECVFCQIIEGELPSKEIYEDENVYAFLDINPLARGHTLIVPKKHVERLEDMDTYDCAELFKAVQKLTEPVTRAVDAEDSNIGVNNGPSAGQEVEHVHVHIIPRKSGDRGGPIHMVMPEQLDIPGEELDAIAGAIQDEIN